MEPEIQAVFYSSIKVALGDVMKALFWTDFWLQGLSIQFEAPELFLVVNDGVRHTRTVHDVMTDRARIRDITGVLTVRVITQFLLLTDLPLRLWIASSRSGRRLRSILPAWLTRFSFSSPLENWKAWAPAKCKMHF